MSTGQAGGAAAGAIVGYILAPATGGLTAIASATLTGASIGMAVGGIIDPPTPETPDAPYSRDIQVNTFDRDTPLPVAFGRVFCAGPVIFVGRTGKITETSGGGKGSPETASVVYTADFAIALSEGPIEGVVKLYRGADDKTDLEGEKWDVVLGSDVQEVRDEVLKVGVEQPVPWRNTAFMMWHGGIGTQSHIPIISVEFDGLRTTRTETGSYSTMTESVEEIAWDPRNRLMHLRQANNAGILSFDQEGGQKTLTGKPSGLTTITGWGVWGLEKMVIYLGQVDADYNRSFAVGLFGDDGTGSGRWITDQLNLAEWGQKILAQVVDQKWGRYIAIVQTATKTTLVRLNLSDLTESKWELPSAYSPTYITPTTLFFDAERDEYYVGAVEKSTGDALFLRGEWGATTVEENSVSQSVMDGGDVIGFGRSGDFIMGIFGTGVMFRFVWNDVATFDTYGAAPSLGQPTAPPVKGTFKGLVHACYAQNLGRLIVLTKPTTWFVTLTEWDGWNWSYVGPSAYSRVSFERRGDPAGTVYEYAKNTRFGPGIPESVLDLGSFEDSSGYCGEEVHNGEGTDNSASFGVRWQLGYVANSRRPWLENIFNDVLPTMAGHLIWQADQLHLTVQRPVQVIAARIGHDDVIEGSLAWRPTDREEVPNGVLVRFRDANDRYRLDIAEADDEAEQGRTGEIRRTTFDIPAITDRFRAKRMAQFMLDSAAAQRGLVELAVGFTGLDLRVGDGIAITHNLLMGGTTDKVFWVFELQEEPDFNIRIGAIEHVPEIFRAPVSLGLVQESDFGDVAGEDGDSSTPEADSGLRPPSRVHMIHQTGKQAVLFPFSYGPNDGPMANVNFEYADSADGPFTALAARGAATAWSMLLAKAISSSDTSIHVVPDSLMGELPPKNTAGYLLIGTEIIAYTKYDRDDGKFKTCTRGQQGTTAAAHGLSAVALKAAYKYAGSTLTDVLSDVLKQDDATVTLLQEYGRWFAVAADETFNSVFVELSEGAGKNSLLVIEYSSSDDGDWKPVPGLIDLSENFKKGVRTKNSGYATNNNTSQQGEQGYTGKGRPIYFNPPADWTKTAKYSSVGDFTDTTPRYYLRFRQITDKTLETPPTVAWIVLKTSDVVIEYDDSRAPRWEYPDSLEHTTQYVRATAVGQESQRSDTVASPIVSLKLTPRSLPL